MTGFAGIGRPTARPIGRLAGGAALVLALAGPGLVALAQDRGEAPHPIHVHAGTCLELGDIVEPLGDVAPLSEGEAQGAASAVPVEQSRTEIALPLADILAAPHAINFHRSAQAIAEYIACGDIGGRLDGDTLTIGLQEMNGSDFSGVAILEEDGPETEVTVYLFEEGTSVAREQPPAAEAQETATAEPAATDEATAEATPEPEEAPEAEETPEAGQAPAAEATEEAEAAAPAGDEIAVDIQNFAFSPDPIAIAVGDTVTWTNQDGVPHTATGEGGAFQSGAIAPGDSFGHTFEEAGEFPYFCEFHPGMAGTVVVE